MVAMVTKHTQKNTQSKNATPNGRYGHGVRPKRARTGGGPKLLSGMLERITKPMLGKRGFAHGAIINNWSEIIGPELARMTAPEKIIFSKNGTTGGVLHLRIVSGGLATEIQHLEPLIVERINQHFGYKAVRALRMVQGPVKGATPEPDVKPHQLTPNEESALADSLCNVDDPEIRAALQSLGRAVKGRKSP